ncbi:hypothetical protein C8F01DRAFT_175231 [Mycena amicta]|nr:hypothetical protein C8F01DRAFT_175231 [Mycena amicta]
MQETLTSPHLPPELELIIFEMAARWEPTSIPTLVLVAKRIREWIEPLLYRTLVFTSSDCATVKGMPGCDLDIFAQIVASKSEAFLRGAVKNVMAPSLTGNNIRAILKACPGLENIYIIWGNTLRGALLPAPSLPPSSKKESLGPDSPPCDPTYPPLRHLYCQLELLFDVANIDFATHPTFQHVTHLELFGDPFEDFTDEVLAVSEGYSRVLTIPNLTHFAVNDCPAFSICAELLCGHSRLQLFVVLIHESSPRPGPEHRALTEDVRFVMMDVKEYKDDWQYGRMTGDDYWARAEAFVARRRAGNLSRDEYMFTDAEVPSKSPPL